ncbi:hypothetical protein KC336_g15992, partial [Hortaea werneckii]
MQPSQASRLQRLCTRRDRDRAPVGASKSIPTRKSLRIVTICSRVAISQRLSSRDSSFTYIHMHASDHADLLESFTSIKLPAEDIYVDPRHQPVNPDEEDDVIPDQHAALGIQRATQKAREPAWKDLGLESLMSAGPPNRQAGAGASAPRG